MAKLKSKSIRAKFSSSEESKLFVMTCEQYMKNLSYVVDGSVNTYDVRITGEPDKVIKAAGDIRQLCVEIGKMSRRDSEGMRPIGELVLNSSTKGRLDKSFLASLLRIEGQKAEVRDGVLRTDASLRHTAVVNDEGFRMLQGTQGRQNLDIRKFAVLVMKALGVQELDVYRFAESESLIEDVNGRYVFRKSGTEVLNHVLANFEVPEGEEPVQIVEINPFFQGGKIRIVSDEE